MNFRSPLPPPKSATIKSAILAAGLLAFAGVGCDRQVAGISTRATAAPPPSLPAPSFTIGPTLDRTGWEEHAKTVWFGMPTPPPAPPTPAPLIRLIPNQDHIDWEARAWQVRIGMRREEVERMLPSYWRLLENDESYRNFSVTTMSIGRSQVVRYHVSENVEAIVYYDSTGVSRDAHGTATSRTSPDNQVTAPVQIVRSKMFFYAAPLLGQ